MARPLSALSDTVPHFVTGAFTSHAKFLPDDVYGQALDSLVKCCTDVLVHLPRSDGAADDAGRILLGKRVVDPQPDWWFAGGRMKPGERPSEAPGRLLTRELGFHISPERLRFVAAYSFVWARRAQPPAENGTADISVVLSVEVSAKEADGITLDEQEYAEFMWVEPVRIVSERSSDEGAYEGGYRFHPALRQAVSDFLAKREWNALALASVRGDCADADLVARLRSFVQQHADPEQSLEPSHHDRLSLSTCSREMQRVSALWMESGESGFGNRLSASVVAVAGSLATRVFGLGTFSLAARGAHAAASDDSAASAPSTAHELWLSARLLWAAVQRDDPVTPADVVLRIREMVELELASPASASPEACWGAAYFIAALCTVNSAQRKLRDIVSVGDNVMSAWMEGVTSASTRLVRAGHSSDSVWTVVMTLLALEKLQPQSVSQFVADVMGSADGLAEALVEGIPEGDFRGWAAATCFRALENTGFSAAGLHRLHNLAQESSREEAATSPADKLITALLLSERRRHSRE